MWSQFFSQPIAVTLSASLGILATAAINHAWDLELWNQWDLLDAILTRYWHPSARFAVFLCAACWCISIFGTNVAANMIPFGSDSSMLFPRYLNIPRGQLLVEFLAFAICPWKILASASVFTTFLSGCKNFRKKQIIGTHANDRTRWTFHGISCCYISR